MKKFIGKPYAGKLHVRFDEGAGKVFLSFPLYSTVLCIANLILDSHYYWNCNITTKIPKLINEGFWIMAHDSRTDFAMALLLLFLIIYGGGKPSIDSIIHRRLTNVK